MSRYGWACTDPVDDTHVDLAEEDLVAQMHCAHCGTLGVAHGGPGCLAEAQQDQAQHTC